ncbi:MAG: NAD(+) diphosphatase [Bacteroides sp.]|nr:NAD(+) diphosphatase [Bacteroides sp.]
MNDQTLKYWFLFSGDQLLLENKENTYTIPCCVSAPAGISAEHSFLYCGTLHGIPCMTGTFSATEKIAPSYQAVGLRAGFDLLPTRQHRLAGRAYQLCHWDRYSQYCPQCGKATQIVEENMKRCTACAYEIYPTITPAVLVLVQKEDRILLVHAHNFKGTFHSLVAGFLEVGESLEECVAREVKEETGLSIHDIRYFGSQSWPYPSGVMIGFTAKYTHGDITLQTEELSSGRFYTIDELPELPGKISLARQMIDWWIEVQQSGNR